MRGVWLCVLLAWVEGAWLSGHVPVRTGMWKPGQAFLRKHVEKTRGLPRPDSPNLLSRLRRSADCGPLNLQLTDKDVVGVSNYSNNQDCMWRIQASQPIVLVSQDFLLEEGYKCRYDYVEIFDGGATKANSLGKFCGRKNIRLVSKNNQLMIQFHSDSSVTTSGFVFDVVPLAAYSNGSGLYGEQLDVRNTQRTFVSPDYNQREKTFYPVNVTCLYSLKASDGRQVKLTFEDFSLETGSCDEDYLTVYDGYSSASAEIGSYCGRKNPKSITSSSNEMLVVFHSNGFITSRGFKLGYQSVRITGDDLPKVEENEPEDPYDPDCSVTITQSNQKLRSPRYGTEEYYLQKRTCRTTLRPPPRHVVKVQFRKFDLEESLDCIFDHVNITGPNYDGDLSTIRLCGYHRRDKLCFYSKNTGDVTLDFSSDGMFEGTGYEADYTFINNTDDVDECEEFACDLTGDNQYCYNNGNGNGNGNGNIYIACTNGKVPDECTENITWVAKEGYWQARGNLKVYEDAPVKLTCDINHPYAYTVWDKNLGYENGFMLPNETLKHITVSGGDMEISSALVSDSGIYTCTVQAGATILTRSINITVIPDVVKCGVASDKILNPNENANFAKVAGDNVTKAPDVIPWQVHIWNRAKESHQCGGVLISDTHVLTAAHCVKGKRIGTINLRDIRVSVGTTSCTNANGQTLKISRYIVHPRHNDSSLAYDFALLELEKPITAYNKKVYPICLPKPNTWHNIKPGYNGIIAGCGKSPKAKSGETPDHLHMVTIPIANRTKCNPGKITDDMFCAGHGNQSVGDACRGDSGGALAAQVVAGRWTLLGLVSFGEKCDGRGYGYYANVSKAIDWIQELAPICGKRRYIEENYQYSKIQYGIKVEKKQLPWVGAFYNGKRYACSVTLLSSTWAVTAKHCLEGTKSKKVVFGKLKRSSFEDEVQTKIRVDFREHDSEDLALLKLKKPVKFSDDIQPACFPSKEVEDGAMGFIAGWGNTEDREFSDDLLYAELAKTSASYCKEKKLRWKTNQPHDLCFESPSNKSITAAQGDSGNGVVMEINDKFTVTAVHKVGNLLYPIGTYVDVFRVMPWIKQQMEWTSN